MKTFKQRIQRVLIKINITSIFFFVLSLISVTLAWFAFSNVVSNNMEISIKAWNININDETGEVNNKLSIELNDFYPGVETYTKTLTINNNGDLAGVFSYYIKKIRILDQEYLVSNQEELLDKIAQDFPFSFNFSINTNHLESSKAIDLNITISWPLDSGNDINDSAFGNMAAEFVQREAQRKQENPNYNVKSCIELIVELNVKQYLEEENILISDNNYRAGTNRLLSLDNFDTCNKVGDKCRNFFVIDNDNLKSDLIVSYIMNPKEATQQTTHNDLPKLQTNDLRVPRVSDILQVISTDIFSTRIKIPNTSDRILGKINYLDRSDKIIDKLIANNGSILFSRQQYPFLDTDSCYWLSNKYGSNKAFAIRVKDSETLELYGENINASCKFVPILAIKK